MGPTTDNWKEKEKKKAAEIKREIPDHSCCRNCPVRHRRLITRSFQMAERQRTGGTRAFLEAQHGLLDRRESFDLTSATPFPTTSKIHLTVRELGAQHTLRKRRPMYLNSNIHSISHE
jgi:hypothetical protein